LVLFSTGTLCISVNSQASSTTSLKAPAQEQPQEENISEKDLVVNTDNNKVEDFEQLESLEDDFKEYIEQPVV